MLIQGSKRAKDRKDEPIAPGRLTTPPDWLTKRQKADWAYAIDNAPLALLRRIDLELLCVFVVAADLHRQASQGIAQFGLLMHAAGSGQPIQSPYVSVVSRQALIMVKAAAELGFTPSSRARMALSGGDDPKRPEAGNDPAAEFFGT